MLEALEQANLLTMPLDLDRAWYRYRHPFAALYGVLLRIRDLGLTLLSLGPAPAGHGRGARREDAV